MSTLIAIAFVVDELGGDSFFPKVAGVDQLAARVNEQ
jgi:hypothetical protein